MPPCEIFTLSARRRNVTNRAIKCLLLSFSPKLDSFFVYASLKDGRDERWRDCKIFSDF